MEKVAISWIQDPWFKRIFFTRPDRNFYSRMYILPVLVPVVCWCLGMYLGSIGFTL